MLTSTHEKDSDLNSSENGIIHDIVAFEFSTVFLQLKSLAKSNQSRCGHFTMFGLATAAKFFGIHSVIAILALLSDDVEIEKKLRHSVGDSHAETLESQNRLVSQMGIYTSYLLYCKACLFVIRIVKNQTYLPIYVRNEGESDSTTGRICTTTLCANQYLDFP